MIAALAIVEFAHFRGVTLTDGKPPAHADTGIVASAPLDTSPPPAFDVTPLIRPKKKYFGVALPGDPTGPAGVSKFSKLAGGKQPNMLTIYAAFDDGFAASEVRKAYQQGALAIVRWEPFDAKLKDIAAGKHDEYVRKFATAIRTLNLPIAMTFAHEMNGSWYPWGHSKNDPEDFVAAWRHVHDIFAEVDATNVIWTWTPNVINPVPKVKLKPLYPGDKYVDWIGIDGYFTHKGAHTYDTLFGPTMDSIRKFTKKPFLIVETGAEPGSSRPAWIKGLIRGTVNDDESLGFVYFNQNGSAKWRIDNDSSAVAAMRQGLKTAEIGFQVK
ncbi:glycosyl hydrolase [Actinoplanes sp. NPDC051346]|uniref:glycoside hydrolase family 26 protein n=1 Tax=Actinoplanes sp. NPDC051346 TaxID=3155048 RepID=UPI00344603D9